MKINIFKLCTALLNFFVIFFVIILLDFEKEIWINISFWTYILTLFFNVFFIYKNEEDILSIALVLYVLYFLFNLSQIYFAYVGYNSYFCIFTRMPFESCKFSFTFAFCCIHIMMVVYYFFSKSSINSFKQYEIGSFDKSLIRILFYLFFGLKIAIRIWLFYVSKTQSYIALLHAMTTLPSYIIFFADAFSIVFLLHSCKQNLVKYWVGFIVITEVLFMFSGSRILGISYLIMLAVFVTPNNLRRHIKLKYVFLIITIAMLLPLISGNRYSSDFSSTAFIGNGGFFESIIDEFGFTILNTCVPVEHHSSIEYLNGLSYYGGLVYIFPNIGNIFNVIEDKVFYTDQLLKFFSFTYGGGNVGEAFLNFGYWGCLVFIPVGMVLAKIKNTMNNLSSINISLQLFWVMFIYQFILWTRSYCYQMVRLPVWIAIFYFILRGLFCRGKVGKRAV